MLFRLVRNETQDASTYNPYVIFIDCKGVSRPEDALRHLVYDGLILNGHRFVLCERSASMTRQGVLSLIDERIADNISKAITMDMPDVPRVLSKYYAYRGLMFSSCHCLDSYRPKIIVVPDKKVVLPNQHIKYICDTGVTLRKDDGTEFEWQQKDSADDVRDIEIDIFDGCGIHHPAITEEIMDIVGSKDRMTSMIIRGPYIKGCSHEIDYEKYLSERGVEYIKDIWGKWHSVHDHMIILTKSMYKGFSYFKETGTSLDWDNYWDKFDKYGHCIGVAKWNFSFDEEPVYTRANYQILQDLNLPYEQFRHLADDSIEWICKIVDGDPLYTYAFLGLTADKQSAINGYMKSVLKNPAMLHEPSVRNYFISLLLKYIDEMKCGKLWIKACFKFLAPDLIMLLQHIGGLPLEGCLAADEFYSSGNYSGEYLIERNPHICKSEHTILKYHTTDELSEYCGHLANVCMVNCRSLTPQRLNGADYDGDLVLLTDNEYMLAGVDRSAVPVIDVDDKITGAEEMDSADSRLAVMLRTLKSFIGEYSNYASAYHNKCPKTDEQKLKYEKFINIISVLTGKSIDYAKTGVIYHMPRMIAKYGRPLPWFMRYRSDYYKHQELSRAPSNMNRLCWDLEKWERGIRWKRTFSDFNYEIMKDPLVHYDSSTFDLIEKEFLSFCSEMNKLGIEQTRIRKYADADVRSSMTKDEASSYVVDWAKYYEPYKIRCRNICPDQKMLANIVVDLQYVKYPNKAKRFMWVVAEDGIIQNIPDDKYMKLPIRKDDGEFEYMGRRYSMVSKDNIDVNFYIEIDDDWTDIE